MVRQSLRIFWKEYRAQRNLWLVLACGGIALQIVSSLMPPSISSSSFAQIMVVLIPLCFIAASAAILFAAEIEDNTLTRLQAIGCARAPLVAGKLAFAVLATTALVLALLPIPTVVGRWSLGDGALAEVGWILFIVLELFAWGMLGSLLGRQTVHAACLTAAAYLSALGILVLLTDAFVPPLRREETYSLLRAGVILVVLALDWLLVGRWLRGLELPAWSFSLARPEQQWTLIDRQASVTKKLFGRLLWLEYRQSRSILLVVVGGLCLLIGTQFTFVQALFGGAGRVRLPTQTESYYGMLYCLYLASALLGALAVHTPRRQLLPLDYRGLSPLFAWTAKQVFWSSAWLISLALLIAVGFMTFGLPGVPHQPDLMLLCFTGYWLSHCGAILAGGGIVGVAVGALLTMLGNVLPVLLVLGRVPVWVPVTPLTITAILSSLMHAPVWMTRRSNRWAAIGKWAFVGLGLATSLAGVAAYRIAEIPWVRQPHVPGELLRSPSEQERTLGKNWQTLLASLQPQKKVEQRDDLPHRDDLDWVNTSEREKEWLRSNQQAITDAITLAKLGPATFMEPAQQSASESARPGYSLYELIRLLNLDARRLLHQNDLAQAWERYATTLRLAKLLEDDASTLDQYSVAQSIRANPHRLTNWCAHPQQTELLLQQAFNELSESSPAPKLKNVLLREYHHAKTMIQLGSIVPASSNERRAIDLLRWMPWERRRSEKLLDLVAEKTLNRLDRLDSAFNSRPGGLTNDSPNAAPLTSEYEYRRFLHSTIAFSFMANQIDEATTVANDWYYRRLSRTILALYLHAKRTGSFPANLEDLVGIRSEYNGQTLTLGELDVVDPFTGELFGYRARGFSKRIEQDDFVLEPNTPVIWCAGSRQLRLSARTVGSETTFAFTVRMGTPDIKHWVVALPR